MKPPASPNARPAFSHVLVFLLAVIMFSISYAVSSLAATVQTATNATSIARDPTNLPPRVPRSFTSRRPAGFQFTAGQYIDVTLLDPLQTDAQGNNRTFLLVYSPCADHCHSHVLPDRVTGLAAMSIRTEVTSMPGRHRTSKSSQQACESGPIEHSRLQIEEKELLLLCLRSLQMRPADG